MVGAGFRCRGRPAYRYRDEAVGVLAAQAPDLHEALQEVAEQVGRTSCSDGRSADAVWLAPSVGGPGERRD